MHIAQARLGSCCNKKQVSTVLTSDTCMSSHCLLGQAISPPTLPERAAQCHSTLRAMLRLTGTKDP